MKQNLVKGPILKSLLLFSIPLLFSYFFQQLYNLMDTMIVAHTLGDLSLAALGAASPVYDFLIGLALGIGSGLSIVCARCFGANNIEQLKKAVVGSIVIGLIVTISITLFSIFYLDDFLNLLNTPSDIYQQTYDYLKIITWYTIVLFGYNLCAGLLNAIGDSMTPLLFLIFSSLLNVGLDFYFILNLNMGVKGAAYATVIAQAISAILCVIYIMKKAKVLIPSKKHWIVEKALYLELLSQGFAMGFMNSIVYFGSTILQIGINDLGSLTIAAHNAARKVSAVFSIPLSSMMQAKSMFVSQNYGANQITRIKKALKYALVYDLIIAIILSVIYLLWADDFIIFISGTSEEIVILNATKYLIVLGPFYFLLGAVLDFRFTLQAMGSKFLPIISSFIELFIKIIFVIFVIPRYQYDAIIWCEPMIWIFMMIQLWYAYHNHPSIKNKEV